MRLFWGVALAALVAFTPTTIASADVGLHISLAYQESNNGSGLTTVLPNVAVAGDSATLNQVNLTAGGPYVNHVFNVYATMTGLSADQDVVFMLFGGTATGGATAGAYSPSTYDIDPPSMGSPVSNAPSTSWYTDNTFNSPGYIVGVTMGTSTGGAEGNTYGDYAAQLQLGESAPFLIGQQVITCNTSGGYNFMFLPNAGYLQIISGNTNGAAANFFSLSYPTYTGYGDSAKFVSRGPTDLTWADGATSTWGYADGAAHWTQTASPSTTDNFYHLDTVRFTSNTVANRTVSLVGNLNPASVVVDSADDYVFTGSGSIIGEGTTLVKAGAGKLTVSNTAANTYTGPTTVEGGTLQLNGTTARNPVLNLGGANVKNDWTKLVIDYTGESGTPAAAVLSALTAGANNGWNAADATIYSTTCAASGGARTLGWIDDGASLITIMVTIPGDANLSGEIDQGDYDLVVGNFGGAGGWAEGDFNYDGDISQADYDLVVGNFGGTLPAESLAAARAAGIHVVPEPGTLALLAAGLFGLVAYAWRKRK